MTPHSISFAVALFPLCVCGLAVSAVFTAAIMATARNPKADNISSLAYVGGALIEVLALIVSAFIFMNYLAQPQVTPEINTTYQTYTSQ